MKKLYEDLMISLNEENKEDALNICTNALKSKSINIVDLYEMILAPALNKVIDDYTDDEDLIWKEHVRSGIIRTIIESVYPYVLEERSSYGQNNKGKIIVMCPEYEDHEIGARMVADFFIILGYDATFIGAKTPIKTIVRAVKSLSPRYICISVTNYYNLTSVKKTIEHIKASTTNEIKFLLGGAAFSSNREMYKDLHGDYYLSTFKDIENLSKGAE